MEKTLINDDVFYTLAWSPLYKYDKYQVQRVLPELPGIVALLYQDRGKTGYVMFLACWRDGCREGLRKLLDEYRSKHQEIRMSMDTDILHYRFTVVDTSVHDMQDIMFWLISTYDSMYNSREGFSDSRRYKNISVKEIEMKKEEVIERKHGQWRR